jgi:hypothetical protein
MTVKRRNDLANMASVYVPEAISELRIAEQNIRDNDPNEALKWIAAALIHLEAFVAACKERAAEEGEGLTPSPKQSADAFKGVAGFGPRATPDDSE